jgi:hypothetical protein
VRVVCKDLLDDPLAKKRYELGEMKDLIQAVGLKVLFVHKVLGPREKITMGIIVLCFSLLEKGKRKDGRAAGRTFELLFAYVSGMVGLS